MIITLDITDNDINIKLKGDIDLYSVYELKTKVIEKLNEKPYNLTIDLSGVSYIDSTGISMLIELKKHVEQNLRAYNLVKIPDDIMQVFRITALDRILHDNII